MEVSLARHQGLRSDGRPSFQFCRNKEFLRRVVILHAQHIRLAANLAVFHVTLPPPCGFVDRSSVPLSARGTLKAGVHLFWNRAYLTKQATQSEIFSVSY